MSGSVSTRTANRHAESRDRQRAVEVAVVLGGAAAEVEQQLLAATTGAQAQLADRRSGASSTSSRTRARRRGARARHARVRRSAVVEHRVGRLAQALAPRRAASSPGARRPMRLAASCARRSARALFGLAHRGDELARAPASSSGRGEITTPSSSSVGCPRASSPGMRPPTSAWWARLAAKPIEFAARAGAKTRA